MGPVKLPFRRENLAEKLRARERLILDLRSLARNAEHLLEATSADKSEPAQDARRHLRAAIDRIKVTSSDLQDHPESVPPIGSQSTGRTTRCRALKSMAITFAAGAIIGCVVWQKAGCLKSGTGASPM